MSSTTSSRVPPIFADDSRRCEESRRRHRLLCGEWQTDLEAYILLHISGARKRLWGQPSVSFSFLKTVTEQMAVRYNKTPFVRNAANESDGVKEFVSALDALGLWQLMQQHELNVLAVNESLVEVSVTPEQLKLGLVRADMIELTADKYLPDVPVKARKWAEYTNLVSGKCEWVLETWSIEDVNEPYFRLEDESGKVVSAKYGIDEIIGYNYPYWTQDKKPLLPFVLYHKMQPTNLWSPYVGSETVESSYELGMLYTYWTHCVKNASFPLRTATDVEPIGAISDDGQTRVLDIDPTGLARFRGTPNGTPSFFQFETAVDTAALHAVFVERERKLIRNAGISETDLKEGSDPMSGRALALTREAQRTMQGKFEPQFRHGDEQLLTLLASAWNFGEYGAPVPTNDWKIAYQGVEKSTEELSNAWAKNKLLLEMGLTSRLRIFMQENPGYSEDDAILAMMKIAEEEALVTRIMGISPQQQTQIGGTINE